MLRNGSVSIRNDGQIVAFSIIGLQSCGDVPLKVVQGSTAQQSTTCYYFRYSYLRYLMAFSKLQKHLSCHYYIIGFWSTCSLHLGIITLSVSQRASKKSFFCWLSHSIVSVGSTSVCSVRSGVSDWGREGATDFTIPISDRWCLYMWLLKAENALKTSRQPPTPQRILKAGSFECKTLRWLT